MMMVTQIHDSVVLSQEARSVRFKTVYAALVLYVAAQLLPAVQVNGTLYYGCQLTYAGLAPVYRLLSGRPLEAADISLFVGLIANGLFLAASAAFLLRRQRSLRVCVWLATAGLVAAVGAVIPVVVADHSLAVALLVPTALPDGSPQSATAWFLIDPAGDSKCILSLGHAAWLLAFALLACGTRRLRGRSES